MDSGETIVEASSGGTDTVSLVTSTDFSAMPGLSSNDFASKLVEKEGVACVPGNAFGASGEGFLRCCFAAGFEQIKVACERTSRFVKDLKSAGS